MALPTGKHVMLSYNWKAQDVVSKIYNILKSENIPVWFDIQGGMKQDIYKSMAEGVENAEIVCCFMSPEYQKSENCRLELQYAKTQGKRVIPCKITDKKDWKPSDWLGLITAGLLYIKFKDESEEEIKMKTKELIDQIKQQSSVPKSPTEPTYLMELIKYEYTEEARIKRIMNPVKSFPIEQSYINLAIVHTKEQREKEKKLQEAKHGDAIISSFEEIYGTKTVIDIRNIFETCKREEKHVLVFGRAGIGKSTFCRYIAYQWARGLYWSQYDLLALIPLRRLTADRYPSLSPGHNYSLLDLVKKENFSYELSEQDDKLLKKQFDVSKTLWVLDGYDEVVQNVPSHLQRLFEQLLKTPHHILTSRPYLITMSYDVQMEITGFTDKNIEQYVKGFFDQMKGELDDASTKSQLLLTFLRSNPSIWGVAHIPINLELICSVWSNEGSLETKELTITSLYDIMIEWLCREYLTKQNISTQKLRKKELYQRCQKELAFLETLGFYAMKENAIIIQPRLLEKALDEAKVSSDDNPHIFNIGILKSFDKQGIGNQISVYKDHYFVHLSFQEYFAARYLINVLGGSSSQEAVEFIKHEKYNQRYTLVFTFLSGLLNNSNTESVDIFWHTIEGKPTDLVGIRHMQLIISCLEECSDQTNVPRRKELLEWIAECIRHSLNKQHEIIGYHISQSLRRTPTIACHPTVVNVLINLLTSEHTDIHNRVLLFIATLPMSNPSLALTTSIIRTLDDKNPNTRRIACYALGQISGKAETDEVINKLVNALGDENAAVRAAAHYALGEAGEKAATNEVINKLVYALGDVDQYVRKNARQALKMMGEKAATNEVINKLVNALEDANCYLRGNVCAALGDMGEKAVRNEVFNKLVKALEDENADVRGMACYALGCMGEKAAINEVIHKLVNVLADKNFDVSKQACEALGKMGEKAATNEVVNRLVYALGDANQYVRKNAREAVECMGEKASTNEVLNKLVKALEDDSEDVRQRACLALREMGEEAVTNEVIDKLIHALGDENLNVKTNACYALETMVEKIAANEVINKLVNALEDQNERVRENAFQTLRKMGEKAVTNEVINKLVYALEHDKGNIKRRACYALACMGEKAATNEVINKLVNTVEDENEDVRASAYYALGEMSKKTGTNEVINKLINALEDEKEDARVGACYVLGKIGEKAATNEVINKLGNALEDDSEDVSTTAYYALGEMGEKAATNEVISRLVNALDDEKEDVRDRVCYVLGKMGKKAATNEVINKLVNAVEDDSAHVRETACYALKEMGEKAATNEVINKLGNALEDDSEDVRTNAYFALGEMGEKAATSEVISRLVNALDDEKEDVRDRVCYVLGKMGKKAATNEVINKLVNAVEDDSARVRGTACYALNKMGEKAATNEVINKLMNVIIDENWYIRHNAYEALIKMGEKVPANEVINKLVKALEDQNEDVRRRACCVLEEIGEKVATNETIDKLIYALGDENFDVRRDADRALERMGEKAATNEIINRLVNAIQNDSEDVRRRACVALGDMGEKAATNEAINKLGNALEDKNEGVREAAYFALELMGKKAGTNEVINKLGNALEDDKLDVRLSAYRLLGRMGEKAATNEVVNKLVNALRDENWLIRDEARVALRNMGEKAATNEVIAVLLLLRKGEHSWVAEEVLFDILKEGSCIMQLKPEIFSELCLSNLLLKCSENISVHQLMERFFCTMLSEWLCKATVLALRQTSAITNIGGKFIVYSKKDIIELNIPDVNLSQKVIKTLTDQAKGMGLSYEHSSGMQAKHLEVKVKPNKSSLCIML